MIPPIEIRRGFGELDLASLKPGQFVTASALRDGGYIIWEKAPVSAETADELVVTIARELYDRFVMGGWEPQDAYPQIREWLSGKVVMPDAGDERSEPIQHTVAVTGGSPSGERASAAPTGGQDGPKSNSRADQRSVGPDLRPTDSDVRAGHVAGVQEVTGAALEPGSAEALWKQMFPLEVDEAGVCEFAEAYASKLRAEVERLTGERDRLEDALELALQEMHEARAALKASEDTK